MIKITTEYNEETNGCKVNYSSDKSNTIEHLYAIQCLVEQVLQNDVAMDWETIRSILNNVLVEKENDKKKEKKNEKRNSKSKAKV